MTQPWRGGVEAAGHHVSWSRSGSLSLSTPSTLLLHYGAQGLMGISRWPGRLAQTLGPLEPPPHWVSGHHLLLSLALAENLLLCSALRHWSWAVPWGWAPGGFCPQHSALSPLSPSALAVGLEWERGGRGGLVHPPRAQNSRAPSDPSLLNLPAVCYQCHQPAMWPSEGIASRRYPCNRREVPRWPFQVAQICQASS